MFDKKYPVTTRQILDSLEADRIKYINEVVNSIAGKENVRADSVFGNITVMKFVKAKDFVTRLMYNWSRSLGVSCNHCHNTANFESDEIMQKNIARSMVGIQTRIHNEILDTVIVRFKGQKSRLNCYTCHHGKPIPDFEIQNK